MDGRCALALPCLFTVLLACDGDLPGPAPATRSSPGGAALGEGLDLTEAPGDAILPGVVCADGATVPGIDVSAWQGDIDWPAVAGDGQKFAFIRVSDGTTYIDDYFEPNWQQARDAGLIVGAYQYFRPGQDPIAQADILLQKMGPLEPGVLPPVIDVEASDGLDPAQVTNRVGQWIDHVEGALGVKPIVYTGKYFWQASVGSAEWAAYPLWIAQYGPVCPDLPDQWSAWEFHQTSSTGKVAGVGGNVDTNLFNGDLAALEGMAGAGGPAVCGDGKCTGGEDSDTCPVDCPPCGTIAAAGGIIDDPDACFHRHGNSMYWYEADLGWQNHLYWTHAVDAANPDNYVVWELHFAEAGTYLAEVYIAGAQASAEQTVYAVTHAGGTENLSLAQSGADGWSVLGEFTFAAGGKGQQLRLDDNTGEAFDLKHQIVFDALRLTRLDAPETTSGGDSSGGDSGTTGASSATGDAPTGTEGDTDDPGTGGAPTTDATTGAGSGSASASGGTTAPGGTTATGGGDLDDAGCGCRSGPGAPLWSLLALPLLRRRRRDARP